MSARVFLVTAVMAAGKSTVAQALAERLPRSVHLRGDVFRKMVVNGRAELGAQLSEEAERQLWLRYELAAQTAKTYHAAGFNVVYQDIVIGTALERVVANFDGVPLSVVVLCPDVATVAARESRRGKTGYGRAEDVAFFDRVLREETPRLGLWVDSTRLTVEETVDVILRGTGDLEA